MKKIKKGKFEELNAELDFGLKGLKISLFCLILLGFLIAVFLFVRVGSFSEIVSLMFETPDGIDYLAIFGGAIIFIAVPFLLGIRVGFGLKGSKLRNKKR